MLYFSKSCRFRIISVKSYGFTVFLHFSQYIIVTAMHLQQQIIKLAIPTISKARCSMLKKWIES